MIYKYLQLDRDASSTFAQLYSKIKKERENQGFSFFISFSYHIFVSCCVLGVSSCVHSPFPATLSVSSFFFFFFSLPFLLIPPGCSLTFPWPSLGGKGNVDPSLVPLSTRSRSKFHSECDAENVPRRHIVV